MSNLSANPIHSTLEIHSQSNCFLKCYSWYLVYASITHRLDYYNSFLIDLSYTTFTSNRLSWTYSQNGVFIKHSLTVTIVCSKASCGFPISPSKNQSPFKVLYSQREAHGESLISLLITMPPPPPAKPQWPLCHPLINQACLTSWTLSFEQSGTAPNFRSPLKVIFLWFPFLITLRKMKMH